MLSILAGLEWGKVVIAIIGAITGKAVAPLADKAKRAQSIVTLIRKMGYELGPEAKFESVYIYTLVEYGLYYAKIKYNDEEQVKALLQFFGDDTIRTRFKEWFADETKDRTRFNRSSHLFIQGTETGRLLQNAQVNPLTLVITHK